jgi:hypothetical protein
MKDPNSESDPFAKVEELDDEAVFGHLEEPFIVAPSIGSTERKFSDGRCPVGDLSARVSDPFSA